MVPIFRLAVVVLVAEWHIQHRSIGNALKNALAQSDGIRHFDIAEDKVETRAILEGVIAYGCDACGDVYRHDVAAICESVGRNFGDGVLVSFKFKVLNISIVDRSIRRMWDQRGRGVATLDLVEQFIHLEDGSLYERQAVPVRVGLVGSQRAARHYHFRRGWNLKKHIFP